MRRIIVIVVLVIVFVCVAVPVLFGPPSGFRPGGAQSNAKPNLQKVTIDKGEITLTVNATGSVVAKQQSNLGFSQPGPLAEMLVQEGQHVEAGQLLARLDDSTQQAALTQANYNLKAAELALQKLLDPIDANDIAKAEANVKAAEASYSSIAGAVSPQQIKTLELQAQKAQTALSDASKLREGAGGQYSTDDPNYQKAVAAEGMAWADTEIARLNLEKAKRGSSLASATANIAYQQALLARIKAGPKQVDIDAAQANYVTAKLQRDQAQHDVDRTQLVAPFAGVISSIKVKVGEISNGTAIVLTDTHTLYIDANVDEVDIMRIHVGQPVTMTLDALSDTTLHGKVLRIAQSADTSASVVTYAVRIELENNGSDNAQTALKAGMTTNVTFIVGDAKQVTRIPNQYLKINRATKQITVNLVNANGSITEVPVKLGLQGTDYSELIDGVGEGETVALVLDNSALKAANGQ